MKIGVVQLEAIKGNIEANITKHIYWIKAAIKEKVKLVVFPELSLSGYELGLARELATDCNDPRFDVFQELSNQHDITICVGIPTKEASRIFLSMIIFQTHAERMTYSKRFLHSSEKSTFVSGKNPLTFKIDDEIIAPAICYELSIQQHHEYAKNNHATIYVASVLNAVSKVEDDLRKLSDIAKSNCFTTCMANYVGESGGYDCAGRSSVWNTEGKLVGQLDESSEGILICDTIGKQVKALGIEQEKI